MATQTRFVGVPGTQSIVNRMDMLYCPRCKERGVNTPMVKVKGNVQEYLHGESPSLKSIGGVHIITCNRAVGNRNSGIKCGYSTIIDLTS